MKSTTKTKIVCVNKSTREERVKFSIKKNSDKGKCVESFANEKCDDFRTTLGFE